jgi:hypothetical protein
MNKEVVQTTPVLERDKITEKNLKTLRIEIQDQENQELIGLIT